MSWGAVISTGVGLVGGVIGAGKSRSAAESAAEREELATAEAIQRTQEAFETSEQMLAPFAEQEYAASQQLMAQLGLPTGGGGGQTMGRPSPTGYGSARAQRENLENFDNVIREMMTMAQVRYKRAGYSGSNIHRNAAQMVGRKLEQMQREGQLPANYQMPNTSQLTSLANEIEDSYGGHTKMARNLYPNIPGRNMGREEANAAFAEIWDAAPEQLAQRFNVTYATPPGEVQAGGPGGPGSPATGGPGQMMGAPGPQAQTAQDILTRAGIDQLPPEVREQYMGELVRSAETDPELAGYLGLTDDAYSRIGTSYQDTPAYRAAVEQGVEAVDAGAAATGSLYSGRRGEALRDVGQDVEQRYYFDAADRMRDIYGRRGQERAGYLGRLGVETAAETGRQQSAYNNYMQLLAGISAPTTATNIENLRQGAATGEGAMLLGTARNIGDLSIGAAGAEQAAIADISSGLMKVGEAFIDRDR